MDQLRLFNSSVTAPVILNNGLGVDSTAMLVGLGANDRVVDAWADRTRPDVDAPFIGRDGQGMWRVELAVEQLDDDAPIPPLPFPSEDSLSVLFDATAVTNDAWARFCTETGRAPPSAWGAPLPQAELGELPVVNVSLDGARAYAAHFDKEVPSAGLWLAAVAALGAARAQAGGIWTTTPMRSGHVVCGGRFRNRPHQASTGDTTSWEDGPADDLSFRCMIVERQD